MLQTQNPDDSEKNLDDSVHFGKYTRESTPGKVHQKAHAQGNYTLESTLENVHLSLVLFLFVWSVLFTGVACLLSCVLFYCCGDEFPIIRFVNLALLRCDISLALPPWITWEF